MGTIDYLKGVNITIARDMAFAERLTKFVKGAPPIQLYHHSTPIEEIIAMEWELPKSKKEKYYNMSRNKSKFLAYKSSS